MTTVPCDGPDCPLCKLIGPPRKTVQATVEIGTGKDMRRVVWIATPFRRRPIMVTPPIVIQAALAWSGSTT